MQISPLLGTPQVCHLYFSLTIQLTPAYSPVSKPSPSFYHWKYHLTHFFPPSLIFIFFFILIFILHFSFPLLSCINCYIAIAISYANGSTPPYVKMMQLHHFTSHFGVGFVHLLQRLKNFCSAILSMLIWPRAEQSLLPQETQSTLAANSSPLKSLQDEGSFATVNKRS